MYTVTIKDKDDIDPIVVESEDELLKLTIRLMSNSVSFYYSAPPTIKELVKMEGDTLIGFVIETIGYVDKLVDLSKEVDLPPQVLEKFLLHEVHLSPRGLNLGVVSNLSGCEVGETPEPHILTFIQDGKPVEKDISLIHFKLVNEIMPVYKNILPDNAILRAVYTGKDSFHRIYLFKVFWLYYLTRRSLEVKKNS